MPGRNGSPERWARFPGPLLRVMRWSDMSPRSLVRREPVRLSQGGRCGLVPGVLEDEELMRRFYGDDAAAAQRASTELVRRYAKLCFSIAHRILKDPQGAEDAVQSAWLRIYQTRGQATAWKAERGPFKPWLCRVVRNTALDQQKKPVDDVASKEGPDTWAVDERSLDDRPDHFEHRALRACLEELERQNRSWYLALYYRDILGFEWKEAAAAVQSEDDGVAPRPTEGRTELEDRVLARSRTMRGHLRSARDALGDCLRGKLQGSQPRAASSGAGREAI